MDENLVVRGLERLGIPFTSLHLNLLHTYLAELDRWNRNYSFVKAGGDDLIVRHLLDSLSGLRIIMSLPLNRSIIDIGSGAGFPGLPLAIFMETGRFTLLERSSKKAAFLRNSVILLSLDNIEVVEKDLKNIDDTFDVATFRALTPINREIKSLKRIIKKGGSIVAYKGKLSVIINELKKINEEVYITVQEVKVPFLEEERHLVVISF